MALDGLELEIAYLENVKLDLNRAILARDKLLENKNIEISHYIGQTNQYKQNIAALEVKVDELKASQYIDSLAGAYTRKFFDEQIDRDLSSVEKKEQKYLTLAMFDIDFFKKVNDTYGHPAGDRVLRQIIDLARTIFPKDSPVFRYGGEEFIVSMPRQIQTKDFANSAGAIVDKFRKALAEKEWEEEPRKITISAGVAPYLPGDDAKDLIKRTDDLLYDAKKAGRDRVFVYDTPNSLAADLKKKKGFFAKCKDIILYTQKEFENDKK